MCARWSASFETFLSDMGRRPRGTTLDRIDGSGNYEPGNCRWATLSVQRRNQTKRGRKLTQGMATAIRVIGKARTLRSIAAEFGISHTMVRHIQEGRYWNEGA
jgi:hypothetical protein